MSDDSPWLAPGKPRPELAQQVSDAVREGLDDEQIGARLALSARVVQRIRYASNETNYCPRCQTGGRLLADRAMSRLLKQDWPRSLDELS